MQQVIRHALYLFLVIFALTAALSLSGLAYLWFVADDAIRTSGLVYLDKLLVSLILEVVALVVAFVSKGMSYLPQVERNKTREQTLEFMKRFVQHGSSVTIVSNRLAWLKSADDLLELFMKKARSGTLFEIITPNSLEEAFRQKLAVDGIQFYTTGHEVPPEARFTMINANRSGAERLAIASGTHPDHLITVFDNNSGPQIIAMAKDIIRISKELADAAKVEPGRGDSPTTN